ncbi:hypothetical protein Prudu_1009S000600 [Prunus dulcis]|uniref:Uncharacterized protein n=1 Tax=Prunus dulcis TaxID=3755 RepID=A0A5H2Y5R6_PRUDU|nr:hypothetical protein Prudu_1009S000600 [Prunus dulcis]
MYEIKINKMAGGRVFVPNKTLVSSPKFPTGCFPLPNSQQTRTRALLSQGNGVSPWLVGDGRWR